VASALIEFEELVEKKAAPDELLYPGKISRSNNINPVFFTLNN